MVSFCNTVSSVFSSWSALQFAISNQTGGPESLAISQWMVDVTEKFFEENEDLEPEEVAQFLCTIMDQELNTLIMDNSDLEISDILCRAYNLLRQGNHQAIANIISLLPKSDCQFTSSACSSHEFSSPSVSLANEVSSLSLACDSCASKPSPEDLSELDGWTLIQRRKKKMNGR